MPARKYADVWEAKAAKAAYMREYYRKHREHYSRLNRVLRARRRAKRLALRKSFNPPLSQWPLNRAVQLPTHRFEQWCGYILKGA